MVAARASGEATDKIKRTAPARADSGVRSMSVSPVPLPLQRRPTQGRFAGRRVNPRDANANRSAGRGQEPKPNVNVGNAASEGHSCGPGEPETQARRARRPL